MKHAGTNSRSTQGGRRRRRERARTLTLLLFVTAGFIALHAAVASAATPADFFGMTTFGQLGDNGEASEIQRLGVHRVRVNMDWRDFQHSNCSDSVETPVSFAEYDKKVRRAAEHNITLIADLYGTRMPTNCPNGADQHEFPMPSTQLYKDFVLQGGFVWQVVQRYGQNGSFWYANPDLTPHPIKIWEVWNEPNFPENNPNNIVWPQGYAKLLVDTSAAIYYAQKELIGQEPWNIGTRVLFGGLWADTQAGNGANVYWQPPKYLAEIYNNPEGYTWNQIHYAYSGLSYHPYRLRGTVTDVTNTIGGTVPMLQGLGEYEKELWVTEIGWPVDFNQLPAHNAQEQANMLNEVMSWTWANREYLHAEYIAPFVYKDWPHECFEAKCWAYWAGIKNLDDVERPAWCTVSNLINGSSCEYAAPAVSTSPASGVGTTSATLNGSLNPRGLKGSYHFLWGTPAEFANNAPHTFPVPDEYVGWEKKSYSVSKPLTGLTPNTKYEFRIVAQGPAGSASGSNIAFTTAPLLPIATTEGATAIATEAATVNGTVNPNGLATTYQFEYGTTTSYGSKAPLSAKAIGSGSTGVAVSQKLEGLAAGTTYHYRVVATNSEGTAKGADKTFATKATGTAAALESMTVTEPFDGSTESLANFSSKWAPLGWSGGSSPKGADNAGGWGPVNAYSAVNGAYYKTTVTDTGPGIATVATMATNPSLTSRYFSLWIDMATPTGVRAGYELRFVNTAADTYEVKLSKWAAGTQTVLASKAGVGFTNASSLAIVDQGGTVSAWTAAGSGFGQLLSAADSSYSSGYAGLEGSGNITRLSKFKAGSL